MLAKFWRLRFYWVADQTGGIPLKLITISGTYDSLVGGNSFPNLPFNEEYNFNVNELINIVL